MIRSTITAALALAAFGGVALVAQQPQTPPTYETAVTMAKDTQCPDDKLNFKPHPDSRTVLDEFRHVTIGLEMTTAMLNGAMFDYNARVKADETKPKTRASVVTEMEAAIAASFSLVEKQPSPRLIGWIDHQGEHYGKLVSSYRMVGIVPPISRPRARGGF